MMIGNHESIGGATMGSVLTEKKRKDGWAEGDAADFLGLDNAESRLIDMKISAVFAIRRLRAEKDMTQAQLAKAIGISQPRLAKLESLGAGVSLDQIMKALFAVGGSVSDLVTFPPKPGVNRKTDSIPSTKKAKSVRRPAVRATAKTR
jgi:DNA-binding XRE family transcriptional regulator